MSYIYKRKICLSIMRNFLITDLNGCNIFFVSQVILKEKVKELNLHEVSCL